MLGIYKEEKIYDAIEKKSKEKGDEYSAFDNEYSREHFLEGISIADLEESITKLKSKGYEGVSKGKEMIETMEKALVVKKSTAAATKELKAEVDGTIKGAPPRNIPKEKEDPVAKEAAEFKQFKEIMEKVSFKIDGKDASIKSISSVQAGLDKIGIIVITQDGKDSTIPFQVTTTGYIATGNIRETYTFEDKIDGKIRTISLMSKPESEIQARQKPKTVPAGSANSVTAKPVLESSPATQPLPAVPASKPAPASTSPAAVLAPAPAVAKPNNPAASQAPAKSTNPPATPKLSNPAPVVPGAPAVGKEKTSQSAITFPKDFLAANKATIIKDFPGFTDKSKVTITGGPTGAKVQSITAYSNDDTDFGVKIKIQGALSDIDFPYDNANQTTDDPLIINGESYQVTSDRMTGKISMIPTLTPEEKTKLATDFPGFFPLSKITLTGDFPSAFPGGKKQNFVLSNEDLWIIGEGGNLKISLNPFKDKTSQVFDHVPYEYTIDKKTGAINFKRLVPEDKAKEVFTAFGLEGDEEPITVEDKRDTKYKIKTSNFQVSGAGDGLIFDDLSERDNDKVSIKNKEVGTKVTRIANDIIRKSEMIVVYDKSKKTITLEDTPRQKIVNSMNNPKQNSNLRDIEIDPKNSDKFLVSTWGKDFENVSLSLSQAKVVVQYYSKPTAYNMYEKGDEKINLKNIRIDNGNLVLSQYKDSENVFKVIITPNGDVSSIVVKKGIANSIAAKIYELRGIDTPPIPSQLQLINEMKGIINIKGIIQ